MLNHKVYLTLTDALDDIAGRSFYEDATVSPLVKADDDGTIYGYVVEDESGAYMSDEWEWTYAGGIADRDSVSETSRLHESYESYDAADHIRYNMPDAVEALEDGKVVTFAYAVVEDVDHREREWEAGNGDEYETEYAGWILAARWDED